MNKKVTIASDSTCDLTSDLIEKYGIAILPLTVHLGENQFRDGVDVTPEDIYAHYEKTGELPKTAAVNVSEFDAFFKAETDNGNAVVVFTISSDMSSTFNNARLAAKAYEDVYVVDTRNLSTGGGLLVMHAAEMAAEGKDAMEIAQECHKLTALVSASFVVDDLDFLYKGGRCSALAAFGANLLQLKPCIYVDGGKMAVGKKYRGKFSISIRKYVADQLAELDSIDSGRVFVTHAGCDPDIIEACVNEVRSLGYFREINVTRAGCTISSHCGRNTLGVLFLKK